MGLTESEIETRLAALRRRREALDREIADLVLYLELGRRLSGTVSEGPAAPPGQLPDPPAPPSDAASTTEPAVPSGGARPVEAGAGPAEASPSRREREDAIRPDRVGRGASPSPAPERLPDLPACRGEAGDAIPPAVPFTQDPTGARRYGRALVEAACAAIAQARRPLHAGEILERLSARGFTLPGDDPVAALNTRLWKRAVPGGPLRRVAEATYALAREPGSAGIP